MTVLQAREIERARYAEFLQQVTHTAFQRLDWLERVEHVYPVQLFTLGYFSGDELVAVTPLIRKRMLIFELWGSPMRKIPVPPATSFCIPPQRGEAAWGALQAWAKKHGLAYLQVTLPPEVTVQTTPGLHLESVENIELDLRKPLVDLWGNVLKKQRYAVRSAIKSGVKVHWMSGASILDQYALLLNQTYAQQGLAPNFPLEFYEEILEHKDQLGLRILCATHGGQCVAVIWVMTDNDCCYYWDAAALDEGRKLNANHLLVWSLIHWAKRNSLKTLDFVGAGGRAGTKPGIKRFKMSMGGVESSRQIILRMTPLMRLALSGFRLMNMLRARFAAKLSSLNTGLKNKQPAKISAADEEPHS